jgi:hypothetical protein
MTLQRTVPFENPRRRRHRPFCRLALHTRIAARRAQRAAAGVCLDCGQARDTAYKRCGRCRRGLAMRVHTSLFRKKEGLRP